MKKNSNNYDFYKPMSKSIYPLPYICLFFYNPNHTHSQTYCSVTDRGVENSQSVFKANSFEVIFLKFKEIILLYFFHFR